MFESKEHEDDYLGSFCSRLREEHTVNTRYIDLESNSGLCGCGKYARVYTERIPLRLSELSSLEQPEVICLLLSMLAGF